MSSVTEDRLRWPVLAGIALVSGVIALALATVDLGGDAGLFLFFLYSIPCEFLVSLAPHDPAVLYLAMRHAPSVVAVVGGAGTLIAETVNYELLRHISRSPTVAAFAEGRFVSRLGDWFARAPFLTLFVAGLIPVIPFSALRPFVLLREYPRGRYLLAATSSRTLRFYLVGLLGYAIRPSPQIIAVLFAAIVLVVTLPGVYAVLAQRSTGVRRP